MRTASLAMALAAVLCTLGGCTSSPVRQRYNQHLAAVVDPVSPDQRENVVFDFQLAESLARNDAGSMALAELPGARNRDHFALDAPFH